MSPMLHLFNLMLDINVKERERERIAKNVNMEIGKKHV